MTVSLPGGLSGLMSRVWGALSDVVPLDDVALGGGTALAARWQHRLSTDIDLHDKRGLRQGQAAR